MIKKVCTAFLIVIFYILQTTIFNKLQLASVSPNLLIILTFATGFIRGKKPGVYTGVFAGLLIDCFSGGVLGFNALIYMYIGYINGVFHSVFFDDDVKLPLLLVVCSDLLHSFAYYVLRFLLRNRLNFGTYFVKVMLPEMLYTLIVAIILYRFFLSLERRMDEWDRRRATNFD